MVKDTDYKKKSYQFYENCYAKVKPLRWIFNLYWEILEKNNKVEDLYMFHYQIMGKQYLYETQMNTPFLWYLDIVGWNHFKDNKFP